MKLIANIFLTMVSSYVTYYSTPNISDPRSDPKTEVFFFIIMCVVTVWLFSLIVETINSIVIKSKVHKLIKKCS